MRDIKFRVFDKIENKFIYSDEFHDYNENDRIYWFFKYLSDKNTKHDGLQLYTGLKDKNSIEIYDGDILFFPEGDKTGIVYFDESTFSYMVDYNNNKDYLHECVDDKIVGNIYKSRTMLEGKYNGSNT